MQVVNEQCGELMLSEAASAFLDRMQDLGIQGSDMASGARRW